LVRSEDDKAQIELVGLNQKQQKYQKTRDAPKRF